MKILNIHFSYEKQKGRCWTGASFAFHYFLHTGGQLTIDGQAYQAVKDSLYFTTVGQNVELSEPTPENSWSYYTLDFETAEDDPLGEFLGDPSFQNLFPFAWGSEGRIFFEETKKKISQVDNPYKIQSAEWALMALISSLVGEFFTSGSLSRNTQGEFNLHVEQALEFLQSRVYSSLTLKEICIQLKITEEHLIRLFKKSMNMTPMKYFNNLKIEAGSSLLLTTDLSVKEIAWRLGFSSPYHFSRNFKLYAGCSPTEYRANYFLHNPQGLQGL